MINNVFFRVFFSASNLNAFAAACLSYAFGSLPGTLIFVGAAIIGCMNKYCALTKQKMIKNIILCRLTDPTITAQILMLAAFVNALMAAWQVITVNEPVIYYIALTLAWSFGVLGDDALRRNDKTNFANIYKQKDRPLWLRTFILTTRNPIFYYLFVNLFFAIALFFTNETAKNSVIFFTSLIILLTISGIFYCLIKAYHFLKGLIDKQQMNGFTINLMINAVNTSLGIVALIQGFYWIVLAQLIFLIANILLYFETRNALNKEHI